MRVILINSEEQTITEEEFDGSLFEAQSLIHVDILERIHFTTDNVHYIYFDEEGMLPHRYKGTRFMINSYGMPIAGSAMIMGNKRTHDGDDWDDCKLSLKEVAGHVAFWIKDVNPDAY